MKIKNVKHKVKIYNLRQNIRYYVNEDNYMSAWLMLLNGDVWRSIEGCVINIFSHSLWENISEN